jgi:hypothetical protein
LNNKIVFLVESQFNKRDYDRFGIEVLLNNGFDVYVWDFTPFIRERIYQSVKISDPCSYKKLRQFYTFEDAKTSLLKLDKCAAIICLIGYNFDTLKIYRVLGKTKIKYGTFVSNAIPPPVTQNYHMLRKVLRLKVKNILRSSVLRIPFQYLGVCPVNFLLAGGSESKHGHSYPTNVETKIVWAHSLDYDIYLEEEKKSFCFQQGMGVFLDEYFPFHPDNLYRGIATPITPEVYYSQLCKFFDLLENDYKVKISIAAHPRSNYEEHPDYYKGRTLIKGQTCHLIRNAEFVIAQSSTAINWAVLFKKPIIFITSNKLRCTVEGPYIESIAFLLNKKPINLDLIMNHEENVDWNHEMMVDHKAYDEYREAYIKTETSPERPYWEIVANFIKDN